MLTFTYTECTYRLSSWAIFSEALYRDPGRVVQGVHSSRRTTSTEFSKSCTNSTVEARQQPDIQSQAVFTWAATRCGGPPPGLVAAYSAQVWSAWRPGRRAGQWWLLSFSWLTSQAPVLGRCPTEKVTPCTGRKRLRLLQFW